MDGINLEAVVAPSDAAAAEKLVAQVLADEHPTEAAFQVLNELETTYQFSVAERVVLSLIYVLNFSDWRLLYLASRIFWFSGKREVAFVFSALGLHLPHPDPNDWHLRFQMFEYFRERGMARDALNVGMPSLLTYPDFPAAPRHHVNALCQQLGTTFEHELGRLKVSDLRAEAPHTGKRIALEVEKTWNWRVPPNYGTRRPAALRSLFQPVYVPEVDIMCIEGAEIWIDKNAIITVNAEGRIVPEASISNYPALTFYKWSREGVSESFGRPTELDTALMISDRHAQANICHFLLDHLTRLSLFERAGVLGEDITVIGPELVEPFQGAALSRIGIKNYVGTCGPLRLKVREFWVSSNSVRFAHPAHFGAEWAIKYLKDKLGVHSHSTTMKLYISREGARHRKVTNNEAVSHLLSDAGFTPVCLEELPFDEQISLFEQATHVVSVHGAGLTHLVSCRPGTEVLEMFHPLQGTSAYAILSQGAKLNYATLCCSDGVSPEPEFNEVAAADPVMFVGGTRDIYVDLEGLQAWIEAVC